MVTFRQILDSGLALQKTIEKNKRELTTLTKEKLELTTQANQLVIKKKSYIVNYGEKMGAKKFEADWDKIRKKSDTVSGDIAKIRGKIHKLAEEGFELLERYKAQTKAPLPANLSKLDAYFETEYKRST